MSTWTYGAELEWPDADTHAPLPAGWAWSTSDYTIVNTNGIANDPRRELIRYGGELNTPIASSPHQLAERTHELWELLHPGHNYRSNLHIHVRVPELTLATLQRIATFTRHHLPAQIPTIDPLSGLLAGHPPGSPHRPHARKRLLHSHQSRHYLLPAKYHHRRMEATTLDQALAAEVPLSAAGRPQWQLRPREAVNLRSLRKHGTIEFRCFAAPANPDEIHAAAQTAHTWLACALDDSDPTVPLTDLSWRLPRQHPYNHALETGWERTNLQRNSRPTVTRYLKERGLLGCV